MHYNTEQSNNLESIISGIYYLSEESYRCGLDKIGSVLRATLAFIEEGIHEDDGKNEKENDGKKVSEVCTKNGLLELMDLLGLIKELPQEKKLQMLALMEKADLKDVH